MTERAARAGDLIYGPGIVSYAQNGEDVVLARALQPDDRTGFWIDIGAADPIEASVTAAFSKRGWRGVNVEPLPESFERLRALRPNDVNLHAAAGEVAGRATLFAGSGAQRDVSTMRSDLKDDYEQHGLHFQPIEVDVVTLRQIFDDYVDGEVDFLKIDAEGSERSVLLGNDWRRFRPRIVVVEAIVPPRTPTHDQWEDVLVDAEYRCVLFDGVNRFYVRNDDNELAARLAAPANVTDNALSASWLEEIGALERERDELRAELDRIRSSRSYRLTFLLRWLRRSRRREGGVSIRCDPSHH